MATVKSLRISFGTQLAVSTLSNSAAIQISLRLIDQDYRGIAIPGNVARRELDP